MKHILLHERVNKKAVNENNSVDVALMTNNSLTPVMPINERISEMDIYNRERKACDKIRLTASVDVVCSNVLFNNVSECVIDEGSDNVFVVNFESFADADDKVKVINKKGYNYFLEHGVVKDTHLSSSDRTEYHCGLDIFNNHTLRSLTFKSVGNPNNGVYESDWNTIEDTFRNDEGKGYKTTKFDTNGDRIVVNERHIYKKTDLLTFDGAIQSKLVECDGWFGFKNPSSIARKIGDDLGVEKTINKEKPCTFIDLCPERYNFDYNFRHNRFKNRDEANWECFALYPSRTTTEGIPFIDQDLKSLRIAWYRPYVASNSVSSYEVCSVCKHGLSVGEHITLYLGGGAFDSPIEVTAVVDDFTFVVTKGKKALPYSPYKFEDSEDSKTIGGVVFERVKDEFGVTRVKSTDLSGVVRYHFMFIDGTFNTSVWSSYASFKKVANGREVDYYVRVFSKIPNFKWAKEKIDASKLYQQGSDLIKQYQGSENGFQTHSGRLSFSQNIYKDAVGEYVCSDDIEFGKLRSNLGFPLTDIFLSFKKTNQGYKEWYGKGLSEDEWLEQKTWKSNDVEYSHIFGKVNCDFELCEGCEYDPRYVGIHRLNNVEDVKGLDMGLINEGRPSSFESDEIIYSPTKSIDGSVYDGDKDFYGDLCSFNASEFLEEVIQPVCYRFNTAQRELVEGEFGSFSKFKTMHYDELIKDDDDSQFQVKNNSFDGVCRNVNGYYYEPHHKVPLQTFSQNLVYDDGKRFYIKRYEEKDGLIEIWTYNTNYLELGGVFYIFDKGSGRYDRYKVTELMTLKKFKCERETFDGGVAFDQDRIKDFIVMKPDYPLIPDKVTVLDEGFPRFVWREVIKNGYDVESDMEVYPFMNGALYVNANVKIYIKRQRMVDTTQPIDIESWDLTVQDEDRYYIHSDIIC